MCEKLQRIGNNLGCDSFGTIFKVSLMMILWLIV